VCNYLARVTSLPSPASKTPSTRGAVWLAKPDGRRRGYSARSDPAGLSLKALGLDSRGPLAREERRYRLEGIQSPL